jgi:hypothetical protein
MRSLSASALLAIAAFALGLATAGRIPDSASAAAAVAKPAGLDWKSDGKSLTLTNGSTTLGFLAVGKLRSATAKAPVPAQVVGQVKIPLQDVNSMTVYRVEAALLCERNGCRPCLPGPLDCPVPPPIPIGAGRYPVGIAPRGVARP